MILSRAIDRLSRPHASKSQAKQSLYLSQSETEAHSFSIVGYRWGLWRGLFTIGVLLPATVGLGQVIWTGGANDNNWSSANNWNSGMVPANDGTATVQFAGSTRTTPNNGAAWSVAGITFNSGADAFSLGGSGLTVGSGGITNNSSSLQTIANAVTLGAAQTWYATSGNIMVSTVDNGGFTLTAQVAAGKVMSFNDRLMGSGDLAKTGNGTLALTEGNSYNGGTTISGGLVEFTGLANFGAGSITLNGGGIRWATGNNADISSKLASLALPVGTVFDTNGNDVTLSGGFSGTGELTKQGAGTLTLSGFNVFSGANVTVNEGTVQATSFFFNANLTIGANGTFDVRGLTSVYAIAGSGNLILTGGATTAPATDTEFSGVISGAGSLTKNGSGTLKLSNPNNRFDGGTVIGAGLIEFSAIDSFGSGGIQLNGGGIRWAPGTTDDISSRLSFTAGVNATFDTNGNNVAFASRIDADANLIKAGAGTLTLNDTNAFHGTTTVNGGTLALGAANILATTTSVTVANGATVDLGGFNQSWPTLAGSGTVALGTAELTVGGSGGSSTFDGVFSGAGNVTKTGAGTFTLGGTNTYTGAMTVSQGTLVFGATDSLAYTSALSIASGATVNLGASQILQRLSGAGAINVGTSILSVGSGGATSSFSGDISGQSGSVKKVGSGLLTVLGNITAPVTISDGTLVNSGSLQGSVSVQSPGLLSGSGTFAGLVTVNSGGTVSPGAGVGTVSFGGGLTINPGAVFNFQLGSTSNQLQITGGTLTGPGLGNQATLNFVAGNGFGPGTYTLMSYASAAVSGDFGAGSFAVGSGLNGYALNLATNGNALQLTVSAIPEPATTAGLAGLAALGLVLCERRIRLTRAA